MSTFKFGQLEVTVKPYVHESQKMYRLELVDPTGLKYGYNVVASGKPRTSNAGFELASAMIMSLFLTENDPRGKKVDYGIDDITPVVAAQLKPYYEEALKDIEKKREYFNLEYKG